MPVLDPERLIDNRTRAIRAYHVECGAGRAELDLSGGIDSAVMACLLVTALGRENVTLAHTRIATDGAATARAAALAAALDCRLAVGTFDAVFDRTVAEVTASLVAAGYDGAEIAGRVASDPTILGSIRSTLRAPLGRAYNRMTGGGVRHGTGNECEDRFLRYYQKGGDGEVDTNPLAMLSKTEVYQLAFALGRRLGPAVECALRPVLEVVPSADLWGVGEAGQTDEAELAAWLGAPFGYGRIDPDTGAIVSIGSIERVARFLDCAFEIPGAAGGKVTTTGEAYLFGAAEPDRDCVLEAARRSGCFGAANDGDVLLLLLAARRAERVTRHKRNLIPTLGSRAELVRDGILTNTLP